MAKSFSDVFSGEQSAFTPAGEPENPAEAMPENPRDDDPDDPFDTPKDPIGGNEPNGNSVATDTGLSDGGDGVPE